MNKKLFRLVASATLMESRGRLRFFTVTVKEHGLPLRFVADRWRSFTNSRWWRRISKGKDYIMVYEPHPKGHGWHIHFLTNFYIPVDDLRYHCNCHNFGICFAEGCDAGTVVYMAKYISKGNFLRRMEGARNVRLVNVSRSMLPLYDIEVRSPSIDFVRRWWKSSTDPLLLRWHCLYWAWLCSFSRDLSGQFI